MMGTEFLEIFEEWSESYDHTVKGHDIEYRDVFLHYEEILQKVASKANGDILEFGCGTGNLTKVLLTRGFKVTGIDPSTSMRKLALKKIGEETTILSGDFLNYPKDIFCETIVSTYAFHHLTDSEKDEAIAIYSKLLPISGKIVFADTMFESVEEYKKAIEKASNQGFRHLAADLQREYYTTIPILRDILEKHGFAVFFERCNHYVWIMEAVKQ
jgi:putative AdoMet-dependent methyltransferase